MTAAERVTDAITFHGEGAVWHEPWGGLRLVDMFAGDILTLDERSGAASRLHVDSPIAAALRPRVGGGFVVATEREFALWGDEGREWKSPPLWEAKLRFNEGTCDPRGRFLCGSMSYDMVERAGAVWRLDADRSTRRLFADVTVSNGVGFTAGGNRAYYVDTPTGRVDVFDVDEGELVQRRPFVTVPEDQGQPDGLTVDAEDGIWVALYGGSAVHHYGADGRLADVVEVDASAVTSCTLGGPGLSTLYVTTSREGLEPGQEPAAGSIFRLDVGSRGLPVLPCAL